MTEKQKVTEEDGTHKEWYKQAKEQTIETLPEFIRHLTNDYEHDYGTICHALSAGAIATATAMNRSPAGRITGFQAGCVMWGFINEWMKFGNKPMQLVDYSNMLYPQYNFEFEKTISEDTWKWLQEEAKNNLISENVTGTHPDVIAHWQSIVDGSVPFGYTIKD